MSLRIPGRPARAPMRVLGSRFLACVVPAQDEARARAALDSLRREFHDATHVCWALRLRASDGARELCDDAGEPAGTAGPPILQVLRGAGITGALLAVARWFGGTKLGTGGLRRAYRDAAAAALARAGVVEVEPRLVLRLRGPLVLDGPVRSLLAQRGGRVVEATYAQDEVVLRVEVPEAARDSLDRDLARLARGRFVLEEEPDPRRG